MTDKSNSLLRLRDLFRGAMLGTRIGDALGMPIEGMSAEAISRHHGRVSEMLPARIGRGAYTDDTAMMIGLAEALLATAGRVDMDEIARRFGENYDSFRGYGQTTATILSVVRGGAPWRLAVSGNQLPGGSFGNGAAMRVAPVTLAFFGSTAKVCQAARRGLSAAASPKSASCPRFARGSARPAPRSLRCRECGCRASPGP